MTDLALPAAMFHEILAITCGYVLHNIMLSELQLRS